jgi:predicted ester cyclase/limonene-1,2-epoxide hydrolase
VSDIGAVRIVQQFFGAIGQGDWDGARRLLADDLTFSGPFDTFSRADDYLAAIRGLAEIIETVHVQRLFVDGDDVCVLYDMVTRTPAGTAPIAEWHRVDAGRISAIRAYFDARPFAAVREAGAIENNKAIVLRFLEEAWNQNNADAIGDLIAPGYVDHLPLPGPGREGLRTLHAMVHAGFPDWHETVEQVVAEGDLVMTRGTITATHQAEYFGIPATGRQIEVTDIHVNRVAGGMIVEHWGLFDTFAMMQQLGVVPAAEAPV